MTLLEAINTGRPFKRKNKDQWCMIFNGRSVLRSNATYLRYTRHLEKEADLKADDFIIEELVIPKWLKEEEGLK